jgi:hypothetical protein
VALDADGVWRPVPVAAHRTVPRMPAPARDDTEDENAGEAGAGDGAGDDWVRRLTVLTGWARPARRPDVDRARVEARAGTVAAG